MKLRKLCCLIMALLMVSAPAMAAKKNTKAKRNKAKYRIVYNCQTGTNGNGCNNGSNCNNGSSCNGGSNCNAGNNCNSGSTCSNGGSASQNPSSAVTTVANNSSSLANEVIRQTNAERAKAGLGSLTTSSALTKAACVRAAEIVEKFSHTRPDGTKWNTVSNQAYGENIAKGHNSADRVMAAWMSSSGHRQNILRPSFGSIGVCAYKLNGILYWVQLFGK